MRQWLPSREKKGDFENATLSRGSPFGINQFCIFNKQIRHLTVFIDVVKLFV